MPKIRILRALKAIALLLALTSLLAVAGGSLVITDYVTGGALGQAHYWAPSAAMIALGVVVPIIIFVHWIVARIHIGALAEMYEAESRQSTSVPKPMETFLICPVRGVGAEFSRKYAEKLEEVGWKVYWPPRDTDQIDGTGFRICADNRAAMKERPYVHVVYDPKSQGSHFDLGMAFAMGKPIIPMNLSATAEPEGKSFPKMMREWARNGHPDTR